MNVLSAGGAGARRLDSGVPGGDIAHPEAMATETRTKRQKARILANKRKANLKAKRRRQS